MNATHTPGPWRVASVPLISGKFAGHYAIAPQAGPPFAIMIGGGPDDIRQANARLIAAAPELMAALRFLTEYVEAGDDGVNRDVWVAQARDALAKAAP